MDKYRIRWHASKTGKSGHGTGIYSEGQAEMIAETLNKENVGITTHSIELVPDEDAALTTKGALPRPDVS